MRALSAPLVTWITSLLLLLLPGSAFTMASSFFGAAGSFFAGLVGVFFGAAAALFFSCLILGCHGNNYSNTCKGAASTLRLLEASQMNMESVQVQGMQANTEHV